MKSVTKVMETKKIAKKFLIIVIALLTIGLFTGATFAIKEQHVSNKDYNPNITAVGKEITVLCLDKNGNAIVDTEIRVTGISNQDIAAIFTTDDKGVFSLSNAQVSKARFGIVTEKIRVFEDAKITKNMINKGQILTIRFSDYQL